MNTSNKLNTSTQLNTSAKTIRFLPWGRSPTAQTPVSTLLFNEI
jgi:hypothetical protein